MHTIYTHMPFGTIAVSIHLELEQIPLVDIFVIVSCVLIYFTVKDVEH